MVDPYRSGVAALFAGHARQALSVRFVSKVNLLYKSAPLVIQGEFVEAVEAWPYQYSIRINGAHHPVGVVAAKWINILAGRKVVEE